MSTSSPDRVDRSTSFMSNPWTIGIVSSLASYIDSCALVSTGTALTIYQQAIGLTNGQVGILSGTLTCAVATGALVGGRLGDRFGRKRVFSITMLVVIAGTIALISAHSFGMLVAGVVLLGCGTGADLPVSLSTIAEASTNANRGKIIGLSSILWTCGIIGANGAGALVGDWGLVGGQIMFAQVGLVAALTFLLRLPLAESRSWIDSHAEKERGASTERAENASVADLLRAPYLKPFAALAVFYTLVNIGANTSGQFGTWINVNIIHMTVSFSSTLTLVMYPIGFLWAIWFMRIVDTPKRLPYFFLGAACYAGSNLIYVLAGFSVATYVIVGLVNGIGASFAFEAIMKVWTQESFPTLLRTTAQGAIIAVARYVAAAVALVTPVLLDAGPRLAYLALFAIMATGYGFAVWGFGRGSRNTFDTEHHETSAASLASTASVGSPQQGSQETP